jgi:precorrin-6A/cobalt-precorrin-6A reductase
MAKHLLILGGTGEARELAEGAVAEFGPRLRVVTSLAGRTAEPVPVAGEVRRGGFGGAAGLIAHLHAAGVDVLIDATHPFATQISRHAAEAASAAGVPRLVLVRPTWQRQRQDRWIEVDNAAEAAAALPGLGSRVWLTVGAADLPAFGALRGTWFLVRRVDRPSDPLPLAAYELIVGRGPFEIADERRLLAEHGIDVLVCRASGGPATEAKLVAAREARLPVVMIRRPPPPDGPVARSPGEALAWLRDQMEP